MLIKVVPSAINDSQWHEYAVRFALGGAATMLTGAISSWLGPSIGGLFLALPAIFCASATLIEKHERERKSKQGLDGVRRGQQAAALDAAGAALGSLGLLAFAGAFSLLVESGIAMAFVTALLAWSLVSASAWWVWLRIHLEDSIRPQKAKGTKNWPYRYDD
jgi:Protein of unknown function (DUF3147)